MNELSENLDEDEPVAGFEPMLKETFDRIVLILKRFMDLDERYYPIIALWIIGTYFHRFFRTYPYLYFNATKASGKTRVLGLIAYLAKNGKLLAIPSEAFIFRKASEMTFCFDEMEHVKRREKTDLRLLLNSAYKRGVFVPRVKKDKESGEQIVESFEMYSPIAMANIYGLEDVLEDRCITIIIEKSDSWNITRKIEAWESDVDIKEVKTILKSIDLSSVECAGVDYEIFVINIERIWNSILDYYTLYTHNTHIYTTTNTTQTTPLNTKEREFEIAFASVDWMDTLSYTIEPTTDLMKFLKKIYLSELGGRELELSFPLITLSTFVSKSIFSQTIHILEDIMKEKKSESIVENRDSSLISMLLTFVEAKNELDYFKVADLRKSMIESEGEEETLKDGSTKYVAPSWLTSQWLGSALRRMGLTKQKRRLAKGIEVILNFKKIDQKAKQLGIERIELSKEEIQANLKEQPDWQDHLEAEKKYQEDAGEY